MSGISDNGTHYKQRALKVYSYATADAKRRLANKVAVEGESASTTIRQLVDLFVAESKMRLGAESHSAYNYKIITGRLVDFCSRQKPPVTLVRQITHEPISRLRQEWVNGSGAKQNDVAARRGSPGASLAVETVNYHIGVLRMLFRYGIAQGKAIMNPALGIRSLKRRRAPVDDVDECEAEGKTLPIDEEGDANYRKLLAAVEPALTGAVWAPGRKRWQRDQHHFAITQDPVRFGLLLELMYETGLRVSDAVHFQPRKIQMDGEVASYSTIQIKTHLPVTVFSHRAGRAPQGARALAQQLRVLRWQPQMESLHPQRRLSARCRDRQGCRRARLAPASLPRQLRGEQAQ